MNGKFHNLFSTVALFFVMISMSGCAATVDPGHAGIKVNYYGSNRGVQDYPIVTGRVWYNPISEKVLSYPTFVQTAVWTSNSHEGSPNNEEISFNSKEGLIINGDISLSYQLDPSKVPAFYVKFRSDDLNNFTHGFLRNVARDAFNEVASTYAVDDLYGPKKEEFLREVRKRINDKVSPFGVEIQQFGFIGAPRLPQSVVDALNMKIKATQDAIRVENELREARAEANKRVATAEGEARANEILTKSITPTLLEWRRLELLKEKWNGALPTVIGGNGGIPLLQLPVQHSK
ncbi:MAG: prohibitin family protein [Patescibacteria group bacterium]|nr:prohibitin family protein [Patescibacteria group bacterium]MDE2438163.1 prohibitin family protein [Patescibacteria group bacterium]